uniref:eIF-4F 25 kDa subunit n=1 Tax=Wollemia nobilis TaxID=56998 RepID=A0A0C9QLX9_9CONI
MAEEESHNNGEVVERPIDAGKKHQLERPWTFWFDNPTGKHKSAAWGSTLRSVYTFSTVEDFWSLYSNLFLPSKLPSGADFHCFKAGIEPKWEDPECAYGGKWTATNNRGGRAGLDALWQNTILAMIGEQFDEGDEICGVVASVRARQEKIALWTRNASNEAVQMTVGRQWKEFMDYTDKIGYIFHEDAKKDKNTKNRYTL